VIKVMSDTRGSGTGTTFVSPSFDDDCGVKTMSLVILVNCWDLVESLAMLCSRVPLVESKR